MNPVASKDHFTGLLIGTAVGDSLGLPAEGLSRPRIARLRGEKPLRHRFLFGRGMVSDDTEHAFFIGQALLAHPHDEEKFSAALAWKLRLWLLGLPAGIGMATLKAILRLWLGVPPHRSGVKSAGNGAAMRAPLIGLFFAHDEEKIRHFVLASSQVTHSDERALASALAVAFAAREALLNVDEPEAFIASMEKLCEDAGWQAAFQIMALDLAAKETVTAYAERLGLEKRVSGYACHSVPVAIYAWLRHRGDYLITISECISCGGDTDTIAAMAGALAGIDVGVAGIPGEWKSGILEWPRGLAELEKLGECLAGACASGSPQPCVPYFWPGLIPRNLLFLLTVLTHGFRRLLPPF